MSINEIFSIFGLLDGLQTWARIVVIVCSLVIIVAIGCGRIPPQEKPTNPTVLNQQENIRINDNIKTDSSTQNSGMITKGDRNQNYQGTGGILTGDNATINLGVPPAVIRPSRAPLGDEETLRKAIVGMTRDEIFKTYGKADSISNMGIEKWKYNRAVSRPYTDSLTDLFISIDPKTGKASSIQVINVR